jgi:FtsH-binding integral membrane protein
MAEDNENIEVGGMSKFMRITLTITAALLIFVGPTYVSYLLAQTLEVDYVASIVFGLVLFIVGLVLLFYLIRKKVIT